MTEIAIFVTLLVLGVVITALGLARTGTPGVTHAERASVCNGLFKYFTEE